MSRQTHTANYYSVLGVDFSDTPDQITKAFRGLALKQHPDKNPGEGATAAFQLINQAYEVLKDRIQRQQYDADDYPRISGKYGSSSQARRFNFRAQKPPKPPKPPKSQTERNHTTRRQAPKTNRKAGFDGFNAGDKVYELRDGKRFHLTATMINRGRMEVRSKDIEDRNSTEKDSLRFQEFADEIRSKSSKPLPIWDISNLMKKDPRWIAYVKESEAAGEKRAQEYFKNAFPELLGSFGTLPDGWKPLWDTFKREYLSLYEHPPDAMSEAAAEAREKQRYEADERKKKQGLDEKLNKLWADFEKEHGSTQAEAWASDTIPTDQQICAAVPAEGILIKDLMAHFGISQRTSKVQVEFVVRANALCTKGLDGKLRAKSTPMEDTEMGGI